MLRKQRLQSGYAYDTLMHIHSLKFSDKISICFFGQLFVGMEFVLIEQGKHTQRI